jgi:glutamate-5-semialdehyde dehydrogenase
MSNELEKLVINICRQARAASLSLATLSTASKNTFLVTLAKRLLESEATIIAENAKDLQAAKENGLSQAMLERLTLNAERIQAMAEGVLAVAALADPVGEEIEQLKPPRGLDLRKVRVPIGVIGIIYESRPNVTIDCAILCLKSGNACILRGGRESFHSNRCLGGIIEESLLESGIDQHAVQLIPTTDRAALNVLL